jgi:hypothetical protein
MRKLLLVFLIFGMAAFQLIPRISFAQTSTDFSPLSKIGDAITKGDLETALSFIAEDAVITETPAFTINDIGTFTGKQEIRKWLQRIINSHTTGKIVGTPTIEGNKLTGTEQQESDFLKKAGISFILKKVEFVIVDGKIKTATYTVLPDWLPALAKAGLIASSPNQGGATPPTGIPQAGLGYSSNDKTWLHLSLFFLGLTCFSGFGLWQNHRRRKI